MTRFLDSTVSGSDENFISPIGLSHGTDNVLSGWDKIFKRRENDLEIELLKLEESQRSKYGPRSIAVPWVERKEGVSDQFGSGDKVILKYIAPDTPRRLRPTSLKTAVDNLKNSTNSGLPYIKKKGNVKAEALDNLGELLARRDPCVLFTRTQEGKKTRTVWGYPIADTILEQSYYQPLLNYQRLLPWRSALLGPDDVDKQMTSLMDYGISNNLSLVSIDFSAYDSSVKESLQNYSFQYISELFTRSEKYQDELEYIKDRFNTIGLVTPDGILEGPHGVPSGSTFTNEVDSIAQYQVARQFINKDIPFQIQGDDGAYATNDPEGLKETFKMAGLNVNEDKSFISKDHFIYLQNYYSRKYVSGGLVRGVYPIYRALGKIVFQERFTDFKSYDLEGSDYYAIRTISILENCKYHPMFREFVEYIWSLDKYGLSVNSSSISNYVKMITDKVLTDSLFKYQYGDEVSGLLRFESVKIINELNGRVS